MTDNERLIFNMHVEREELLALKLELMTKLQDKAIIQNLINRKGWKSLYIYGGGNLGIQTYYAFSDYVRVLGFIDRKGITQVYLDDVRMFFPADMNMRKENTPIIITPIEYTEEIIIDMSKYVNSERMIQLNELF